jgi:hypothetical protein
LTVPQGPPGRARGRPCAGAIAAVVLVRMVAMQ